jgi:hypothetical protein
MKTLQPLIRLLLPALAIFSVTPELSAQDSPLNMGELNVFIDNNGSLDITITPVTTVYGSESSWFPPLTWGGSTHSESFICDFVDRAGGPDTIRYLGIGYAKYSVTVQGHTIYCDFRDANWNSYKGDLYITYYPNRTPNKFRCTNLDQDIPDGNTIGIWAYGNDSENEFPSIPITVTNPSGKVVVDADTFDSPRHHKLPVDDGFHPISAYNPNTPEQGQSMSLEPFFDMFAASYDFPSEPTGLTPGYADYPTNRRIRLSWSASQGTGITYEVWSDLHMEDSGPVNEWRLLGTTSSTSFVDGEWEYNPYSGDYHINYRVRSKTSGGLYSTYAHAYVGGEYPHKNYPNPFNPSTQLAYSLAEAGRVYLAIYDVLGREIANLANGEQKAGRYKVTWNAKRSFGFPVSSGIYFARLRVTNELGGVIFTKTTRLLLMK